MTEPFERRIGRGAKWRSPADTVPRVRIGDTLFTGTAVEVTRYRDYSGRLIVQIELVDGIAL